MSKHTPAPWAAHLELEEPVVTSLGSYGEPQIALVSNIEGEAEFNARLIAAAPEMLEALINIAEYLGAEDAEQISALITKATGGDEHDEAYEEAMASETWGSGE